MLNPGCDREQVHSRRLFFFFFFFFSFFLFLLFYPFFPFFSFFRICKFTYIASMHDENANTLRAREICFIFCANTLITETTGNENIRTKT